MKKKLLLLVALGVLFPSNFSDAKVYYSNVQKSDNESVKPVSSIVADGDVLCEQYKLDSAKAIYLKALKQNPKNSDAHNGLGMVYYFKTTSSDMAVISKRDVYLNLAQKEFQAAIKYNPNNFKAYNNLGEIYQEFGNLPLAISNYNKALALKPNYSESISNLASVDFVKNKLPESVSKYKKALSCDSKNLKAYLGLAQTYAAQGKYADALTEANTALSLFPNSAKAHAVFGKIYDEQGNKVAAINSYRKAISIKPENVESYAAIAEIYQVRGDNDLAIAELKNAISVNPNYKEAYLKLADMSLLENKPEAAISYYQKVVNDPVYSAYALKGLSKAYFYSAKNSSVNAPLITNAEYIDAQKALLSAIDANPRDLQLYLALVRVSKIMSDDEISQLYLSKIIAKSDFSPVSLLIQGEAQLVCNNYKQAYQDFTDAIAKVDNAQDSIYLGDIFIENRQYDMAQAAFYKALGIEPENKKAKLGLAIIVKNQERAKSCYHLAQSFYKHGERVSAVEELKTAVAYNPKDKQSQLLLAKAYEQINNPKGACEHYQMYVNLLDSKDRGYKKYSRKVKRLSKKVEKLKATPSL